MLTLAHNSGTAINLEGDGVRIMDGIPGSIPIIKCPCGFSRHSFVFYHQNRDVKFEAQLVTGRLTQGVICVVWSSDL